MLAPLAVEDGEHHASFDLARNARTEEGDAVERGQVLARLSRDMLDAQSAQNAASLSRALAAIAQAKNQIVEAEANSHQADAALNGLPDTWT